MRVSQRDVFLRHVSVCPAVKPVSASPGGLCPALLSTSLPRPVYSGTAARVCARAYACVYACVCVPSPLENMYVVISLSFSFLSLLFLLRSSVFISFLSFSLSLSLLSLSLCFFCVCPSLHHSFFSLFLCSCLSMSHSLCLFPLFLSLLSLSLFKQESCESETGVCRAVHHEQGLLTSVELCAALLIKERRRD